MYSLGCGHLNRPFLFYVSPPIAAGQAQSSKKNGRKLRMSTEIHSRFKTRTNARKREHYSLVEELGKRFGENLTTIEGQTAEKQISQKPGLRGKGDSA